jgi:hypothetical protein
MKYKESLHGHSGPRGNTCIVSRITDELIDWRNMEAVPYKLSFIPLKYTDKLHTVPKNKRPTLLL